MHYDNRPCHIIHNILLASAAWVVSYSLSSVNG